MRHFWGWFWEWLSIQILYCSPFRIALVFLGSWNPPKINESSSEPVFRITLYKPTLLGVMATVVDTFVSWRGLVLLFRYSNLKEQLPIVMTCWLGTGVSLAVTSTLLSLTGVFGTRLDTYTWCPESNFKLCILFLHFFFTLPLLSTVNLACLLETLGTCSLKSHSGSLQN